MDAKIIERAAALFPEAVAILREAVRLPADHVDLSPEEGGDPRCGLSDHEGPRLESLRRAILEIGAVARESDVGFDGYGNLWWRLEDPTDGVPPEEKTVVLFDGHTDTVAALRQRWHERLGEGLDPYEGLVDPARVDWEVLGRELGHLPEAGQRRHLLFGRGSADQLGGVVCQMIASKILNECRGDGALRGVVLWSFATVSEEENEGQGPGYILRRLASQGEAALPDVVVLTEGTGCAQGGALGIYRGQRGRMQIEVEVIGKSCHGSMPWEGLNPLEYSAAIIQEAADRHARGEGMGRDPFLGDGTRTASFADLETPSDCAVPERFRFRFDRRLTAGEDPEQALADIAALESVRRARQAGLTVEVRVPTYDNPTWRGHLPGNRQIYPGWVTPEDDAAVEAAVESYRCCATPLIERLGSGTLMRPEPRVARWIFSTDGVGYCVPEDGVIRAAPAGKGWLRTGPYRHPPMVGIGPGIEQNTHKVGECVETRELVPVIAWLARFPSLYQSRRGRD